MATAREQLYEEIVALTKDKAGDNAVQTIDDIMMRYRVQTKPGVKNDAGKTARDTLAARLVELWRTMPDDVDSQIGTEIDKFRMQAKAKKSGGAKKKAAPASSPSSSAAAAPKPRAAEGVPVEPPPPQRKAPAPPPDLRRPQPVAGGPRRRGKTRSECPKCHSMGVVLARSYSGDEYFSCIYCGWQAYKPADDLSSTASLAGRLLGRSGD